MTIQACYEALGADYAATFQRLPNEAMLMRLAKMFLKDDSFQKLKAALAVGDAQTAFREAHTLKGVCLNLGFSQLYEPTSALTEVLRSGALEGSQPLFAAVEREYERTANILQQL